MSLIEYPSRIQHWIDNTETSSASAEYFEKKNPVNGETIAMVARGNVQDADRVMRSARAAFAQWSSMTSIARGEILRKAAAILNEKKIELGAALAYESGQSLKQGQGEIDGTMEHLYFWASEGSRMYGTTMPSKTMNRFVYTIREAIGVVLVITPANMPFGGRAIFPALLAGNVVVMKPSEDIPNAAIELARALKEAGLPSGVFSVLHGFGNEVGAATVTHPEVDAISFTGSVAVGKMLEQIVTGRKDKFVKLSLELGGKNSLFICDDADIDVAVKSAILSAFSLAGQRCAAASRIIVLDEKYEEVKNKLVLAIQSLRIGTNDIDDLGPVINKRQLETLLTTIQGAVSQGANILAGGNQYESHVSKSGYFMSPTLLENVNIDADISCKELFGPVTILFRASTFDHAIEMINRSTYGLTASIHTKNVSRAQEFIRRVHVGVVHVNGHTYGSEPHMPFGGYRNSGNGTREAGTEALNFYTNLKTVTMTHDSKNL